MRKTKQSSHLDLKKWTDSGLLKTKVRIIFILSFVEINNKSLKDALFHFISKFDLPFAMGAMPPINNTLQTGISNHLAQVFLQSQVIIKLNHLTKQKTLCFTTDAWTAQNMTAFMALMAHYIDDKFEMKEMTLAHTRKAFSYLFYEMSRELSLQIPAFNTSTHLLGCIAHVINLASKAALSYFGDIKEDSKGYQLSTQNMNSKRTAASGLPSNSNNCMISEPDGASINSEANPQLVHLGLLKQKPNLLMLDKWDQSKNIMISGTTLQGKQHVMFFQLSYTEHHCSSLYDLSQIIVPAASMISKINNYLADALMKPIYICAMIIDPTFKTSFWITHSKFIINHYGINLENIMSTFRTMAIKFEEKLGTATEDIQEDETEPLTSKNTLSFSAAAFYQLSAPKEGIEW
ncbi:uncharacterized protein VP01_3543g2 [Puccinia sorghi]|uniref:hAT-like transposase RNase-H fold domain-containing protein n=1 Tax=Puccinia sorghi TaxID=27349 RepID=A0A0L6UVH2_9BASI|nr:uncharacterized protein VP01_3543g2 [Puccinia sorghi]